MNAGITWASLLLLVAVAGAVAIFVMRRRRSGTLRSVPGYRHPVTRIVCGTLAGIILIAIAIGTMLETRSIYSAPEENRQALLTKVPTRDPGQPEVIDRGTSVKAGPARFLVHIIIGVHTGNTLEPMFVDEFDVDLPADKGRHVDGRFSVDAWTGSYGLTFNKVFLSNYHRGKSSEVRLDGQLSFRYRSSGSSGSRSGGLPHQSVDHLAWLRSHSIAINSPLSIAPGARELGSGLHALCTVTRVARDDPLEDGPVTNILELHASDLGAQLSRYGNASEYSSGIDVDQIPIPGLALAVSIGRSSLLLAGAAILLAQLFRRRALALAGTLFAVMLYVSILDRAVLAAHAGHVENADSDLTTRLAACTRLSDTFLHRAAARRTLDALMQDETTPEALKGAAANAAYSLTTDPAAKLIGYLSWYPRRSRVRLSRPIHQIDVEDVYDELRRQLPIELLEPAESPVDSPYRVRCRNIEHTPGQPDRLEGIVITHLIDGQIGEALGIPLIRPAFVHAERAYFYCRSNPENAFHTKVSFSAWPSDHGMPQFIALPLDRVPEHLRPMRSPEQFKQLFEDDVLSDHTGEHYTDQIIKGRGVSSQNVMRIQ